MSRGVVTHGWYKTPSIPGFVNCPPSRMLSRLLVISLVSLAQTRWMTGTDWMTGTRWIIWRPLAVASLKPVSGLTLGKGYFSVSRYMAGKGQSPGPRYIPGKRPPSVAGCSPGKRPPSVAGPTQTRHLAQDRPRELPEARTTYRNMSTGGDKILENDTDIFSGHEAETQDRNKEKEIGRMMQSTMTRLKLTRKNMLIRLTKRGNKKLTLPFSNYRKSMLIRIGRGNKKEPRDGRIRIL